MTHHWLIWLSSLCVGFAMCSIAAAVSYDNLIGTTARLHGMEPALIKAVVKCESNFDDRAVSSQGAQGLMQLMPATQATLSLSDAFDPQQNVAAGVRYLTILQRIFGTSIPLLLAAYNAGPQAVIKVGYEVPPFAETQHFVNCVEQARRRYRSQGFNQLFTIRPTPKSAIATDAPILADLRVPPTGGYVGQRLILNLNAWNISSATAHGVISLTYPEQSSALFALQTTPDTTTVQLPRLPLTPQHSPTASKPIYQFIQGTWPIWPSGQQRTATLALVPRYAQDIALHLSVLLYDRDRTTLQHRWSQVVRIPIQLAPTPQTSQHEIIRQEHGSR